MTSLLLFFEGFTFSIIRHCSSQINRLNEKTDHITTITLRLTQLKQYLYFKIPSEMPKVQLDILGLSFSQTQDNAYVLILVEHNGERRIPIIIGGAEAQAIAIQLENLQAPRPLTHDLFLSLAKSFNIEMQEVMIHTLKEGIFYSKIICKQNDKIVEIDSRTSDAVALAVRFGCQIYTTSDVIAKAGIVLEIEKDNKNEPENTDFSEIKNISYENFSTKELQDKLQDAVESEDYEKASEIRDELKKRETNN